MKAVGFVASIITLIGAATLTSSTLTRLLGLKGSPLYVVNALNEVNDFNATLTLVQTALQIREVPHEVQEELGKLLARAQQQLEAFNQYLKAEVLREEHGSYDTSHLKLRRRAKLKEIIDYSDTVVYNKLLWAVQGGSVLNLRRTMDEYHETSYMLNSTSSETWSIVRYAAVWADIETMDILQHAPIKSLPMGSYNVERYWHWFNLRDTFFVSQRGSHDVEVAAYQALLDSVVTRADIVPMPPSKPLHIPGAFEAQPQDEKEAEKSSIRTEELSSSRTHHREGHTTAKFH
ncbi:hypothetical protein EK21DRAFT_112507 [Setomelanomma holmii]|uniref:Uncharacterized protein n=1 Tax=Setomelanomma holmii TaxID=210430 RepID=A0A9P4H9T8_9PLEO|nr:hypothetical protein EK21DRAFT_112507 [Setomelanomma holmii]